MTPGPGREAGQSVVELAVVLPIVVMLLLAVVQVGAVARDHLLVHHAAREAARRAAIEPNLAGAEAGAAAGAPSLDPRRLSVDLDGGTATGDVVTARVVYASPTDVPVVGALMGDVELSAKVTMRIE